MLKITFFYFGWTSVHFKRLKLPQQNRHRYINPALKFDKIPHNFFIHVICQTLVPLDWFAGLQWTNHRCSLTTTRLPCTIVHASTLPPLLAIAFRSITLSCRSIRPWFAALQRHPACLSPSSKLCSISHLRSRNLCGMRGSGRGIAEVFLFEF